MKEEKDSYWMEIKEAIKKKWVSLARMKSKGIAGKLSRRAGCAAHPDQSNRSMFLLPILCTN